MKKVQSVRIFEVLRFQILRGELAPGERLITRELARIFGVSDIPVREALWMLARDGLVDMNAYVGARVASLTHEEILEVLFIRSTLEGLATELAASRIEDDGLAVLRTLLDQQEIIVDSPDPDPLEYASLNRQFHSVIFDYSGNRKLTQLIASIWEGHSNLQTVFRLYPDRLRRSLDEHRAIYQALARHDAKLAGQLAAEHKKLQQQDLLTVLSESEPGDQGGSAASA